MNDMCLIVLFDYELKSLIQVPKFKTNSYSSPQRICYSFGRRFVISILFLIHHNKRLDIVQYYHLTENGSQR